MGSNQKLSNVFVEVLSIKQSQVVDDLQYNSIREWDSVAHMTLVAALEDEFDVMFDTDEIIEMSSVLKSKEILTRHGVEF